MPRIKDERTRSQFEFIGDHFDGFQITGDLPRRGHVRCPAHGDSTPSLSISEGDDGRVLLYCHAGCKTEEVLKTVGLTMSDLFTDSARSSSIIINSGRTDAANARRFVHRFGDDFCWVGEWDRWIIWTGSHWKLDEELRIETLAKEATNQLWIDAAKATWELTNDQHDLVKKIHGFASKSNSARGIRDAVSLARSEHGVPASINQLDPHDWLLNVRNGVVDLRNGDFMEHDRKFMLTKISPVKFDIIAKCPQWMKFLKRIFNKDQELISYVQRLVGYCLTGDSTEHVLPFLYGVGSNGKSTFVEVLMDLLGPDYSMKASRDLVMMKKGQSHPTDLADLYGRRFIVCSEAEDGRRLAESLVKDLTGGDRIRARRMRENFWEFKPTHHLRLVGNHKPVINGTDHGIWRRVKLIPFEIVIPPEERDPKLREKLQRELPGILNWAIDDCQKWREEGLQEPERITQATQSYAKEMDEVGRFIDDYCERGEEFQASATLLYEKF